MPAKRVLVLFPSIWDARQFASCRGEWAGDYEVEFAEPGYENCPEDLEPLAYIDALARRHRGRIDGVLSSNDYPGATIAAALASRLGLPGSSPDAIVRATHKFYSRQVQRAAVPEATPRFWLIDPAQPGGGAADLEFPCFVKPVKGTFSVLSQKINDRAELDAFLARPVVHEFIEQYMTIFNAQVKGLTDFTIDGRYFVAESFMHGTQVTVEGCVADGRVEVYGIVDSIMHAGTGSFGRFDLPSALSAEICAGLADTASRAVLALGISQGLFNVEMIYQPLDDSLRIIEVNPRICGQFGDLYQKVLGVNSYLTALDVVTGTAPRTMRGQGLYTRATSFPLRTFQRVKVLAAPSAERVAEAESLYPGTLIWNECESGSDLADFQSYEDGASARYAVVNLGGNSRAELNSRLAAVKACLGHEFQAV
jgi:hypothetical protein